MRALLLSLILILATAINCYASNSVYIKQTDQTGSSVFIKQDGSSNVVGINTTNPILIQGNNVDVIIKQIGNSNDVGADFDGNQPGFMGTNMTFDYQVTGNSNDLELDQSDINSTGHWYDIDITGSSNKLIFRSDASKDVDNTNVDLDVRGSSNYMKFYVMEDNHFLYVLVDGDSNTVKFKALDGATGFNTNANKAIGPNVESHGMLADSSGSEGATIDYYIIGNSNRVEMTVDGDRNYSVHDVIGNSNLLDLHADASGHTMMAQIGDNNWLRTITYGDSNDLNIMQQGDDNKLYIYLSTDNAVINAKQKGNNNDGNISVTGDSIYDYTLNFSQNGSDTCVYSYNRNNQSADVTATVSNGC